MVQAMKWRVSSNLAGLRIWDNESVAYCASSGDTHHLGEGATFLLQALDAGGEMDVANLQAAAAAQWQLDDDPALAGHIEDVLAELRAIALIEPVPC